MQASRSEWWSVKVAEVDVVARKQALSRQSCLTKPAGSLGELERIVVTLAGHQGRECPQIENPEVFVFAADHGVAAQGVSAYPQSVTAQMVHNFLTGGAAVSVLAKLHDARLTVVNMGVIGLQAAGSRSMESETQSLEVASVSATELKAAQVKAAELAAFLSRPCNTSGTRDFTHEPAMTHAELQHALAAGRECVELALSRGCDLFIAGEMGIGNTTSASAVACALLAKPAAELVGLGTGISNQTRLHKCAIVDKALLLHTQTFARPQNESIDRGVAANQTSSHFPAHSAVAEPTDCGGLLHPEQALEALRCLGGFEIAAITGAALACAQYGLTLLVDGFIVSVAALVAATLQPGARDWMLFAHQSAEAGHNAVLTALDAHVLLKLDMRLGEGSGAALALPILKAACALHARMATFAQAGVDDRATGADVA